LWALTRLAKSRSVSTSPFITRKVSSSPSIDASEPAVPVGVSS
jgi:hypothetical protein